jgi:serine/threonine protein kinase
MPKKAGSEIGKKRRGSFKSKIPEIIDDEYLAISQDLLKQLGYLFREYYFLTMFRKMYFPSKSLEECAQFIVDNEGENLQLFEAAITVNYFEILLQSNSLHSNERTICTSFEMLMNTFVKFNHEYNKKGINIKIRCPDLLNRTANVKIIGSKNKNGNIFFYSKSFEIQAQVFIGNESKKLWVEFVGSLRDDIRLVRKSDCFDITHMETDDGNHPVILGSGSFGAVFKIMGDDGIWYVVKTFKNEEDYIYECENLIDISSKGKHKCIQSAIGYQTGHPEFGNIIVSKCEGFIPLSDIQKLKKKFSLKEWIQMFLEFKEGIEFLHSICGILHCDIKPQNIVLKENSDGTWSFVLIDFGISENIGGIPKYQSKCYFTSWYRSPFLITFPDLKKKLLVEIFELSRVMDWWAFFITMINTFFNPKDDFRRWGYLTEKKAFDQFFMTSFSIKLINEMGIHLQGLERMNFIRKIYLCFLNDEGIDIFKKTYQESGMIIPNIDSVYNMWKTLFEKLRREHPTVKAIEMVFNPKRFECESSSKKLEEVLQYLTELFIEILYNGADEAILGITSMKHIESYFRELERIFELISKMEPIYF